MSTFEKLHRDVYSVLQKHAAHTKCDLWFGRCSQRAGAEIARRSGSVHCLPGSKSLANSYVDGKNRQRVFAVLTVDCCVDIFVLVWEKGPWVNRVRPDSLLALSLKGELSIYIEYLSDRTGTVGCILGGHRQFDRRVT